MNAVMFGGSAFGPSTVVTALTTAVLVLLGIVGVVGMVITSLRSGDRMDRPNRIKQVYGYTVCLVAVISGLIATAGVVSNAMDLSNPLVAERNFGEASLTSFESYRATRDRFSFSSRETPQPDTTSDATLRVRYAALRADRITERTFQARKGILGGAILLALAATLFVTHWRWLRGLPSGADA